MIIKLKKKNNGNCQDCYVRENLKKVKIKTSVCLEKLCLNGECGKYNFIYEEVI